MLSKSSWELSEILVSCLASWVTCFLIVFQMRLTTRMVIILKICGDQTDFASKAILSPKKFLFFHSTPGSLLCSCTTKTNCRGRLLWDIPYSSLPNKRTSRKGVQGGILTKKINKRTGLKYFIGCQRIPKCQKSKRDQMDSHYMGLEDSKKPNIFSKKWRLALPLAPSSFI